jgi:hypothetical protein
MRHHTPYQSAAKDSCQPVHELDTRPLMQAPSCTEEQTGTSYSLGIGYGCRLQ